MTHGRGSIGGAALAVCVAALGGCEAASPPEPATEPPVEPAASFVPLPERHTDFVFYVVCEDGREIRHVPGKSPAFDEAMAALRDQAGAAGEPDPDTPEYAAFQAARSTLCGEDAP